MKFAVLVTGARDFSMKSELQFRMRKYPPGTIFIHGDAAGADTLCHIIVQEDGHYGEMRVPYFGWLAQAGGPARNGFMLDVLHGLLMRGYHVAVEAFPMPGCRGTADMVKRTLKAGIFPIHIYGQNNRNERARIQ